MIQPIGPVWAQYITDGQVMWPEAMREPLKTFEKLLESGLCSGWFHEDRLVGWSLVEPDRKIKSTREKIVHFADMSVHPEFQHRGIMKALTKHTYADMRWRGNWIHMYCRRGSYPSVPFLARHGYEIVWDRFLRNFYGKYYKTDKEDGRELLIKPIGQ